MEAYVILGIIIGGVYLLKASGHKGNNTGKKEEVRDCVKNCIWKRDDINYTKEVIATFENGVVYYKESNSIIGYYDSGGNVYNNEKEKIGFIREYRMYMTREFKYEQFVKMMPNMQLKKPNDLIRSLGEVLGSTSGTIYENDDYGNAMAYFELKNEGIIGVGAAYIVLVYEEMIDTRNRLYYKMEINECF